MQVKNFGMRSQVKWTHLTAEDTSTKDALWTGNQTLYQKTHSKLAGHKERHMQNPLLASPPLLPWHLSPAPLTNPARWNVVTASCSDTHMLRPLLSCMHMACMHLKIYPPVLMLMRHAFAV